jgi:hypothetical protein
MVNKKMGLRLSAETVKNTFFVDLTPRDPVQVRQRFGGTFFFQLQGRRASNLQES